MYQNDIEWNLFAKVLSESLGSPNESIAKKRKQRFDFGPASFEFVGNLKIEAINLSRFFFNFNDNAMKYINTMNVFNLVL